MHSIDSLFPFGQYVKPPETAVEHVMHATKETYNYAVVLGGIGLAAGIASTLYFYLFSETGTQSIVDKSSDIVQLDPVLASKLGTPLVALSRFAQHDTFEENGNKVHQMNFLVKGPRGSAAIKAEVSSSFSDFFSRCETESPSRVENFSF